MTDSNKAALDAQLLLLREYQGILSTHSQDIPGYPFGSVMPYCLDQNGQPVMLISRIAQHTKNIKQNSKVSLIVRERDVDDTHLGARLTWVGDAQFIEDNNDIAERYYRFFPQSRNYHKTHDFDFYRINLVRARFIGGFGEIFWIKNKLLLNSNPFFGQTEADIVQHMNDDHQDALVKYCKLAGITLPEETEPYMVGVNSLGIHLRVGRKIFFVCFSEEVSKPFEVRQQLVAMATNVS